MSIQVRIFLVLMAALLPGSLALRGAEPGRDRMERWVRQLGDKAFQAREEASRQLWQAGPAAEELLEEAAHHADLEVARRAKDILEKSKFGIYPDTPPKILKLIQCFRTGDEQKQNEVVKELIQLGRQGCRVALKLAATEKNKGSEIPADRFWDVVYESNRIAATLAAEKDFAGAEELLELTLNIRDYVLVVLVRGQVDDRIALWKKRFEKKSHPWAISVLEELYSLKGDRAGIRWVAKILEESEDHSWIDPDLFNWKAELKRHRAGLNGALENDICEKLPLLAFYERMSGQMDDFEKTIVKIRNHVPICEGHKDGNIWYVCQALILNERPQTALEVLIEQKNHAGAFDFLCTHLRHREAFELAGKEGKIYGDVYPLYTKLDQVEMLYALGEKEKALALLGRLAREIPTAKEPELYQRLAATETKLGLRESALDHFAQVLDRLKAEESWPWVWEKMFPPSGETAQIWWQFLRRQFPGETTAVSMKRMQKLFIEKERPKEIVVLLDQAERMVPDADKQERKQWLDALAQVSSMAGEKGRAGRFLEKAAEISNDSLLRLGDFLAEQQQWELAAKRYGELWENNREESLPLFLQGRALVQAGKKTEGARLMEQAHWLPLGDTNRRARFAKGLRKRGLTEAARRELDLILRTSKLAPWKVFEDDLCRAQQWEARKEYLLTAACWERNILDHLGSGCAFHDQKAMLSLPWLVHYNRARGLLVAGSIEEALKEAKVCLKFLPGAVEMPIALVPELDKSGRKKEADELFAEVFGLYEKLCADYPRCAWGHNNLAWLAARCRRQLDQALEHGRQAVALEPANADYLGTLAEVHFQRRENEKALEQIQKCIKLEPKKEFFRKQKERIEAGDPQAPLPEVTK